MPKNINFQVHSSIHESRNKFDNYLVKINVFTNLLNSYETQGEIITNKSALIVYIFFCQ